MVLPRKRKKISFDQKDENISAQPSKPPRRKQKVSPARKVTESIDSGFLLLSELNEENNKPLNAEQRLKKNINQNKTTVKKEATVQKNTQARKSKTIVKKEATIQKNTQARKLNAIKLIRRHTLMASGSGLIPLPFVDAFLISAILFRLLKKLTSLYHNSFSSNQGKQIITFFLSSYSAGIITLIGSKTLIKMIPGVGTAIGSATMPVAAGSLTSAFGTALLSHFEQGGNLSNFKHSIIP
jgi:uncharacterized protein (DUF697 family)